MGTKGIAKIAKNLGRTFSKNSPTILTVCAVGGLVTTAIFAVKATPKALELIAEQELEKAKEKGCGPCDSDAQLTKYEVVRASCRCYIPAVAIGLASIACIIGANRISLRRNAALASVYTITEAAFKEYQAKVVETIGQSKELKVRDELSAEQIKANPPRANQITITGNGRTLCYDTMSGRYFKSDIEEIRRVINDLNRDLMSHMWLSLNDLYYALDLRGTKLGEDLGWDLRDGLLEIRFSTQLSEFGEPCIVMNYDIGPKFY